MRGLAVAFLLLLALAPAAPAATVRQNLDRALETVKRHAAVAVYDTRAKRTVYALRAGSRRPLASNTKLFTAAAALQALGPLPTTVHAVGDDLYLVGGGDPTLGTPQIEELARQVYATGVRSIAGGVVGDGSRFEPPAPLDKEVAGVPGALVYDRGRAVDGGALQTDPALAAATRFDDALEALGITIAGGQRTGVVPAGAPMIAGIQSPAPAGLVALMNKPSDNFVAEMLTKALGAARQAPGTTAGGVAEIVRLTGGRASLVDGTGLALSDRAAPRDVVALLRGQGEAFRASLPVAGRDGTLRYRMRRARGRCRAKTGTHRAARVSALSGYCGRYAFSLLIRGARVERAERAGDAVAAALARSR